MGDLDDCVRGTGSFDGHECARNWGVFFFFLFFIEVLVGVNGELSPGF